MKEQSIDDILKLLKDSVAAEQGAADKPKPEKKQKEISTEDLQQKLKNQYLFDASEESLANEEENVGTEYVIDSDFLAEVERSVEESPKPSDEPFESIPDDNGNSEIEVVDLFFETPSAQDQLQEEQGGIALMQEEISKDASSDIDDIDADDIVEQLKLTEVAFVNSENEEDVSAEEEFDVADDISDEEISDETELVEQTDELIELAALDEQDDSEILEELESVEGFVDIDEPELTEAAEEDVPFDMDDTSVTVEEPQNIDEVEATEIIEDSDDFVQEQQSEIDAVDKDQSNVDLEYDELVLIESGGDEHHEAEEENDAFEDEAEFDLPEDNVEELIAALKPTEYAPDEHLSALDEDDDIYDDELPEDNVEELIAGLKPIEEDASVDFDEVIIEKDELEEAEVSTQEIVEEDISLDDSANLELDSDSLEETNDTFLATIRKTGIDFTTGEMYHSLMESKTDEDDINELESEQNVEELSEEQLLENAINEAIDPSTVNLMMQFCEKEELDKTIGDKNVDEFLKYENSTVNIESAYNVFGDKEYMEQSQQAEVLRAYKKKSFGALWTMLGCGCIALIALIYELLPLFEIRLAGILDYKTYPSVYALIGLQFVVFSAAIYHKQIWRGLKRAFSLTPNADSFVALILALTVIYDIITVIVLAFTNDDMPCAYNAIAVCLIAVSACFRYFNVFSEKKAFEIYSDTANKYTLVEESANSSVGSKMYGGGIGSDKKIYTVHSVDFPNGFFKSVNERDEKNTLMTLLLIPMLIVGVIASIITMILGADAYASFSVCMLALYFVLPVALITSENLPYAIAVLRLSKRGSAFAGKSAIDKYSDCDIMVFNDLHIFKKCKTEEVGIAIYDNKVGYLVLGCIDALYSKIGGPLSGMKMNLPDVFKFDDVIIRRMTRNGIEAIIGKKHTLIVGEAEFMQRYGLVFPPNEQDNGRSTLCVSLDGKVTAKLSVKYEVEPIFEMLIERLNSEGIKCAIQTYDPLINSVMIGKARTIGDTPVSVIHNNATDFHAEKKNRYRSQSDGVVSCASRLKLAELEIWLKRLSRIKQICKKLAIAFSSIGAVVFLLLVGLGVTAYVEQIYVLLYFLLETVAVIAVMLAYLPSKRYFTVDALYEELERAYDKEMRSEHNNTDNK